LYEKSRGRVLIKATVSDKFAATSISNLAPFFSKTLKIAPVKSRIAACITSDTTIIAIIALLIQGIRKWRHFDF
jgi:hypothetical protein